MPANSLDLQNKVRDFHKILAGFGKVAVAFSGGVDSSFLLKSCLDILGSGNVLVIHGRSCLQKKEEQILAANWLERHDYCSAEVQQLIVDLQPLSWPEMAANNEKRCYHCKRQMYSIFLKKMELFMHCSLLDGTNSDDCRTHRPGLQAIRELGVQTPLAQCGLEKDEIRLLSRELMLDTHDQPSSSCLATRIPTGMRVTTSRLQKIALWEQGLAKLGFIGCRAKIDRTSAKNVEIQLQKNDLAKMQHPVNQQAIHDFFLGVGIEHVHISSEGR